MTNIEREQSEALARKSVVLREVWLRERQESLSEQLTANAEAKKRWNLPLPTEEQQGEAINGKRSD
ncbi:MAG: hypothetical protein JNM09_10710 [Blastocatellia bacterium]|nr:hypothetical protein [Blastocatellia bacterium]